MFGKQPSFKKTSKTKKKPSNEVSSNKRSTSTSSRVSAKGSAKKVKKKTLRNTMALDFSGIETDISMVLSPDSGRRRKGSPRARQSPRTSPRGVRPSPRKDSPGGARRSPRESPRSARQSPRTPVRSPKKQTPRQSSPKNSPRSPKRTNSTNSIIKSPRSDQAPETKAMQDSIRQLESELETSTRQINDLISEKEKLVFVAEMKNTRIAELEKLLEEDRTSTGVLKADVQSCMNEHQRAIAANNSLRREVMALERELTKRDQTELITQSRNSELESKLSNLRKNHERTLDTTQDLQSELAGKSSLIASQKESTLVEIMRLKRDLGEQGRIAKYNLSKLEVDHARITTENVEQKYMIMKQADKIRYLADANTALTMVARSSGKKERDPIMSSFVSGETSPPVSRKSEEHSTPRSSHWR